MAVLIPMITVTAMGRMPVTLMNIDSALLVQQWLSPAFPVGAFAYSHGIEGAVDAGWISDASGVQSWLEDLLAFGAGRSDPLFLSAAYHAADAQTLATIDAQALAFQPSKERAFEMTQQGEAFVRTLAAVWQADLDVRCYPVALGAAAAAHDIALELVLPLYLQAFVSNLIAAAQRLLPIGQSQGQDILRALTPAIQAAANHGMTGDLSELASAGFLADIAAMKHETQYSRIFRS